jgi:hypothetical protein
VHTSSNQLSIVGISDFQNPAAELCQFPKATGGSELPPTHLGIIAPPHPLSPVLMQRAQALAAKDGPCDPWRLRGACGAGTLASYIHRSSRLANHAFVNSSTRIRSRSSYGERVFGLLSQYHNNINGLVCQYLFSEKSLQCFRKNRISNYR